MFKLTFKIQVEARQRRIHKHLHTAEGWLIGWWLRSSKIWHNWNPSQTSVAVMNRQALPPSNSVNIVNNLNMKLSISAYLTIWNKHILPVNMAPLTKEDKMIKSLCMNLKVTTLGSL